jgi:hypothetical protein
MSSHAAARVRERCRHASTSSAALPSSSARDDGQRGPFGAQRRCVVPVSTRGMGGALVELSYRQSRRAAPQLVGPFPTHLRRKISTESRSRPQPWGRWIGSEGFVVGSSRSPNSIPGCRLDKPTWRYLTSRWRFRSICRFPLGFHSHLEGCRMPRSKERRCAERHRLESCSPERAICGLDAAEFNAVELEAAELDAGLAALHSSVSLVSPSLASALPVIPAAVTLERSLQSSVTLPSSRSGAGVAGLLAQVAFSPAGFFRGGLWRTRQRAASSPTGFSSICCCASEAAPSSRQGNSLRTGWAASVRSETGSVSVRAAMGSRARSSGARRAARRGLGEMGWMRLSA